MNFVTIRIAVVGGSGPRERALCSSLLADLGLDLETAEFADREAASAFLRAGESRTAWVDASLAPDRAAFGAFLASPEPSFGFARGPHGDLLARPAAAVAPTGPELIACRADAPRPATPQTVVGDWLSWTAQDAPPRPLNGLRARFHGHGWGFTGYAAASRHLMLGLRRAGVDLTWIPDWAEGEPADLHEDDRALLETFLKPATFEGPGIVYFTPTYPDGRPALRIFQETLERRPLIAATVFETETIPARWVKPLADSDRVWVPSTFNARTFAAAGVPPEIIDVVPHGLDYEHMPLDGPRFTFPAARSFVFLSMFEWRLRKGYDVLLRAYARAFRKDDDVSLVIRSGLFNLDVGSELRKAAAALGLDPAAMAPIIVLPNKIPQAQLGALYRAADAFVLPSRGEGFGLPYLEAMAYGLPTIGTAYGGPTDFLDETTGYPIPARLVDVDAGFERALPFYRGQRWAEPSVEETARAMRSVFEDRDEARRRAARAAARARTRFTREAIGRIAARSLQETPTRTRPRAERAPVALGEYVAIAYSLAGYGSEARSFLGALDAVGAIVKLHPVSYEDAPALLRADESRRLKRCAAAAAPASSPILYHLLPTQVPQLPAGRATIVRTMEETDGLADGWAAACNRFSEVWVPSHFNYETFARAGVDERKLRIVPGAIDTDFWTPDNGQLTMPGWRGFRFLSIFDWMSRKGWDLLVTAYCRAFSANDDVSLTLKTTDLVARAESKTFDPKTEIEAFLARTFPQRHRAGDLPPIIPLAAKFTEADLVRIYGSHDAFVVPSRAEGWGRAHFEAMACGLPTVGTRWGGNLAFMNDENSYLIDVEALVPAERDTARYAGRRWALPSVEHLTLILRRLYEHRDEARARGRAARRHIVANFSFPVVGALLRERFEALSYALHEAAPPALPGSAETDVAVIVVDAAAPTFARCASALAKATRSPYALFPVAPQLPQAAATLEAALAKASAAKYVAVLASDVVVGPGWDRILIDAIESRYNVVCAVPLARTATGAQRMPADADRHYDAATLTGFERFAVHNKLLSDERGAYADALAPACAMFDAARLRSLLAESAPPATLRDVLQLVLRRIGHAWVAADCYVHDDGSAASTVNL